MKIKYIYYILGCLFTLLFISEIQPVHFITDVTRWLFEIEKIGNGLHPYRDFTWQYPPFSVYLFGVWASLFGNALISIKILHILIGLVIFYLSYSIIYTEIKNRSNSILLVTLVFLLTNFSNHFRLFSIQLYTPAVLTALLGTILTIFMVQRLLYEEQITHKNVLLLALGLAITLSSKPEWGLATLLIVLIYALANYKVLKIRFLLFLMAYSFGFTMVFYGPALITSGVHEIINGITGYGFAGGQVEEVKKKVFFYYDIYIFICLVSAFVFGTICIVYRNRNVKYLLFLMAAVLVLQIVLVNYPNYEHLSQFRILKVIVDSTRHSPILLIILLSIYPLVFKTKKMDRKNYLFYFIIGFGVLLLNLRVILLGGHFSFFYPFSLLITFLIVKLLTESYQATSDENEHITFKPVFILSIFAASCFLFFNKNSTTVSIETKKGEFAAGASYMSPFQKVLDYLSKNRAENDKVISIPYGGNFEYVLGQNHNIYQTQFVRFSLSEENKSKVVDQLKKINPKFIVSMDFPGEILNIKNSARENDELWKYINNTYKKDYEVKKRYVVFIRK